MLLIFLIAVYLCIALPKVALADSIDAMPIDSKARIHVLSFGNTDAILLESNGRFGLVDAGEDNDYPDGSDPRYPLREGITRGNGVTDKLFTYMKAMGVTDKNLEFIICTHPHSDHIGGADEVIEEFKPERVYLMPYKDRYISNPVGLWDNLYVYDKTIEAAITNGATLIQGFDERAPVNPCLVDQENNEYGAQQEDSLLTFGDEAASQFPEDEEVNGSSHDQEYEYKEMVMEPQNPIVLDASETVESIAPNNTSPTNQPYKDNPLIVSPAPEGNEKSYIGNPNFKLGTMSISIFNYDTDYFETIKFDANRFSLGVLVEANGHRAFLAGDIEYGDGDEDRLAQKVGKVDYLKIGHHGWGGSNSPFYLRSLAPQTLVMTAPLTPNRPTKDVLDYVKDTGSCLIDTVHQAELNRVAVVADFSQDEIVYNVPESHEVRYVWRDNSPHYVRLEGNNLKDISQWKYTSWGDWYFFNNSPYAEESAWHYEGNHYYYLKADASMAKNEGVTIDGKTYLFDGEGHMMSLPQGWSFAEGAWRYGVSDGTVKTGWLNEHGTWYYLDPKTGAMAQGWAQVDSAWYYFAPGSGAMRTGWLDQGGAWYYLQGSGAMAQGWLFDRGSWYYLIPGSGAMARGWAQIGNTWYYLSGSGAMVTGWLNLGGTWYYLAPGSGAMVTGWLKLGGTWYYLTSSGAMARGWVQVDNTWYYLRGSGAMATGWIQVGGTWYYLTGSGAMATGWIKLGATWYYLTPGSGAMVTGSHVIDGTQYSFNGSGAWVA